MKAYCDSAALFLLFGIAFMGAGLVMLFVFNSFMSFFVGVVLSLMAFIIQNSYDIEELKRGRSKRLRKS